jgi:hypothetical protein
MTSATGPPATADDSFATNVGTALVIAAPGVLGNDLENGGGAVSAVLITDVTSGTLASFARRFARRKPPG